MANATKPKYELFTAELPPSNAGRQAKPIDTELREAFEAVLRDNPVGATGRPNIVGLPTLLHDTEGKASAEGRRYARPIAENLAKTVRVKVVEGEGHTEAEPRYGWVIYVPLAKPDSNGDSAA